MGGDAVSSGGDLLADAAMAQTAATAMIEAAAAYEEQILLFTTKTCPNCRIAGAIRGGFEKAWVFETE